MSGTKISLPFSDCFMVSKVGKVQPHTRIEMYILEYDLFTTASVVLRQVMMVLLLNDESGTCARRISGSDCVLAIMQKRA